nr:tail fiber protein [uncultured Pedobacter sp.]
MKLKNIFIILFLFTGKMLFAQNTFPGSGNVGIGTTNPNAYFGGPLLQIEGQRPVLRLAPSVSGGSGTILFKGSFSEGLTGSEDEFHLNYVSNPADPYLELGAYKNSPKTVLTLKGAGNVGIGTTDPRAKLDVAGNMLLKSVLTNTSPRPSLSTQPLSGEIRAYSAGGYAYDDGLLRLSAGAGTTPAIMSYIDISSYSTIPDMDQNIVFGTAGEEKMRIHKNGNIGIGTATPNEKLTVNGKIRAREIKVEATNWPDYVFEKNYQIASLGELEKYIKTNKHLPEMPGAKEVESNGVELGNLVKKLLKNQEELTLHLIAQEKIIKAMEKKLNIQHNLKTKSKRK